MKTTLQFIANDASFRKARAATVIATFAHKLADLTSAAHTMAWSEDAFKASADLKVWSEVEHFLGRCAAGDFRVTGLPAEPYIDHKATAEAREMRVGDAVRILRREFDGRVLRAARYPARSTSIPSNLVEQEVLRASAEALEVFDSWLHSIASEAA